MNLKDQWGRKPKKNKKPRKGPQSPFFQDPAYEDEIAKVVMRDPTRAQAERHAAVLHMNKSRENHQSGRAKARSRSLVLFAATEKEEREFIEGGSRVLPADHPLKKLSRSFRPSQHIMGCLDQKWPRYPDQPGSVKP